MKIISILALASALFLSSCSKSDPTPDSDPVTPPIGERTPVRIYSFTGEHYAYCPSVILADDRSADMFFCGNPDAGVFVDNVFHCRISASDKADKAVSVLQPSLEWDSRHVCDPCVVGGKFRMNGKDYTYAMFFLSNQKEYYYNEIGVAFSNSLSAEKWDKYPKQIVAKPWSQPGDLYYSETGRCWGVGQPSAISLDKAGKVLLTYTQGDITGTRIKWCEADLSNMDSPKIGLVHNMVTTGLKGLDGKDDWTNDGDFAYDFRAGKLVMVRPLHPLSPEYPAYISSAVELDSIDFSDFRSGSGSWSRMYRIDRSVSGFPRNHDACIARDVFGQVKDWTNPFIYFTVSKISPDVEAVDRKHAEWTYDIWKL